MRLERLGSDDTRDCSSNRWDKTFVVIVKRIAGTREKQLISHHLMRYKLLFAFHLLYSLKVRHCKALNSDT